MASDIDFVEYVVGQIKEAGVVRFRKMFGDYAVYVNNKVVGLICDNQFFVKPTDEGKKFVGDIEMGLAYDGAKPSFLITDQIDDEAWLTELVHKTADALPLPKPKKKRIPR
jgi:TfoX/Sxy family transcriptional regulator of competence genes